LISAKGDRVATGSLGETRSGYPPQAQNRRKGLPPKRNIAKYKRSPTIVDEFSLRKTHEVVRCVQVAVITKRQKGPFLNSRRPSSQSHRHLRVVHCLSASSKVRSANPRPEGIHAVIKHDNRGQKASRHSSSSSNRKQWPSSSRAADEKLLSCTTQGVASLTK
jgi:hypothetical protein